MDKKTDDIGSSVAEALAPVERAEQAGVGGAKGGQSLDWPKRFSAKMKLAAVQRLLRGESLEMVSRDRNVPAYRLSEWRDCVLAAAEGALKERERDDRDAEIERLKAKVGEITMANELLYDKIARLETGRPLGRRRSRT